MGDGAYVIRRGAAATAHDVDKAFLGKLTGDAPTAYKEFLDRGGEGFHHLAWWAEDFDAVEAAVAEAGREVVLSGDGGGTTRFLYIDAPTPAATCLEVMELNDMTRGLMDHVRQAAEDWDGTTNPIRNLF